MDVTVKLKELAEETLSFGEIISHSGNPADKDYREACHLFSQHLSHQLQIVGSYTRLQAIQPEMHKTNSQLNILNELINPQQINSYINYDWNAKVESFFSQLKALKKFAA